MSNGRKIESEFENPVDNLFIKISEHISGPLVKIRVTPNMITTLSFICGLISIFLLYKDHYLLSGCLYWDIFSIVWMDIWRENIT